MTDFVAALAEHGDDECCMFTTVGRRSGREHRIEIWFGVVDGALYLISGNGPTADWYRNALAEPNVVIEFEDPFVASSRLHGRASEVIDADERRRVGDVMAAKYPWDGDPSIGLTRQAWCYEVPVLKVVAHEGRTA